MKLRIKDNSVRLRLTQSEVARCSLGQSVSGQTRFAAGGEFRYALVCSDDASISAQFADHALTVSVPAEQAMRWADSDRVSLAAQLPVADGTLSILIEKDFACLSPREGDDDADTFAHPKQGEVVC